MERVPRLMVRGDACPGGFGGCPGVSWGVWGCRAFPQLPHAGPAGAARVTPHGKTWGMQTPGLHGYRRGRAARRGVACHGCCLGLALLPAALLSFPGSQCTEMMALFTATVPLPPHAWEQQVPLLQRVPAGCQAGARSGPFACPSHCPLAFGAENALCKLQSKGEGCGWTCRLHQGCV